MAVLDYGVRAKYERDAFFAKEGIPTDIKDLVRRFLLVFQVSDARKSIFFRAFAVVVSRMDSASDFENRDRVNQIFSELYERYATATYHTQVSVTIRFVRWLNHGERPKSFCDIKAPKKRSLLRNLKPTDMVTWKEGIQLANATFSVQFKAVILFQLDGGFRPSEFFQMRYGDLKLHDEAIIAFVRDGKTGQRIVVLHRSAKWVRQWLEAHPTKDPQDPLWFLENPSLSRKVKNGTLVPYEYDTLRMRLKRLAKRIGLNKPVDFYNLRHSSCVLDKLDNLPVDVASDRHGHSVKHYTEVYGRLSTEDTIARYLAHYRKST